MNVKSERWDLLTTQKRDRCGEGINENESYRDVASTTDCSSNSKVKIVNRLFLVKYLYTLFRILHSPFLSLFLIVQL